MTMNFFKRRNPFFILGFLCSTLLGGGLSPFLDAAETDPWILTATYDGAINPAAAEWLIGALRKAHQKQAEAVVIELDTPGGLLESTRILVQEIMASSVPVAVYIAPSGARGASAGTFIALSAHIAAMAPGTRIGAAHPVELGKASEGDLRAKMENDAVAFIKSVAEARGRNAQWAEDAVRKSSSATEQEALRLRVVDCIAPDLPKLLQWMDGREVVTASGKTRMRTRDARRETYGMTLRVKILKTLSDPNIAYILMMVGVYGILYEMMNPGAVFPGVAGGICLILGLYALQTLPISYAGAALMVLALLLFAIESQITSGLVGLGGIVALLLGSLMLIPEEFPEFRISRALIFSLTGLTAAILSGLVWLMLKIKNRAIASGPESMAGEAGVAATALDPEGQVLVRGEIWNAEAPQRVEAGEPVEVVSVKDLKLLVRKKT